MRKLLHPVRSFSAWWLAPTLVLCVACGSGGEEVAEESGFGTAVYLLDRPPIRVEPPPSALSSPLAGLLAEGSTWVLDEEIGTGDWREDGRPSETPGMKIWMAGLRYRQEGDPRATPIDRLHIVEEREPSSGGKDRASEAGEAVLISQGLSVARAPSAGRPEAVKVSYQVSTTSLRKDLPSVDPRTGLAAPREEPLEREASRVLALFAPWSRTWSVRPGPEARLHFAFGVKGRRLSVTSDGVRVTEVERPEVSVRVLFETESGEVLLDQLYPLDSALLDSFQEVTAEFGATTEAVELTLSFTSAGSSGQEGPLVFLAEPVIERPLAESDPRAPNVLLLLIDTLRADRLGCGGCERARTPNIDALAESGVCFSQAWSAAPWTLPSHASLFTSLYATEHGLTHDEVLPEEAKTLAEALRSAGYRTAAFTEGAYVGTNYGLSQGFSKFHVGPRNIEETLETAKAWVSEVRGPFFAFVHTYQVHSPYNPPAKWREELVREYEGPLKKSVHINSHSWGRRRPGRTLSEEDNRYLMDLYDAEIAHTDEQIGVFVDWLRESGQLEDTIIIVTSDHGEEFGDHGQYGHGYGLYEEQLHVPLIISGPAVLPGRQAFEGGLTIERPILSLDLAPTICDLTGVSSPAEFRGESILLDEAGGDTSIFVTFFTRRDREFAAAYRVGDEKFIDFPESERPQDLIAGRSFFDLALDPLEQSDLFPKRPREEERWKDGVKNLKNKYPPLYDAAGATSDAATLADLEALGYAGEDGEDDQDGDPGVSGDKQPK